MLQASLTLSLSLTKAVTVRFQVLSIPSHVVLVAVTFFVQTGVYCFVHIMSPGVRVPLLPAASAGIPPHQLAVP
jgi:hypothetical protein